MKPILVFIFQPIFCVTEKKRSDIDIIVIYFLFNQIILIEHAVKKVKFHK